MTETPRVLLVEDEDNIALALSILIERAGYRPVRAVDGETAKRLLAEDPPDLVVLDAMLPGLSGFDLCEHIRATPGLRNIRILMVSAAGEAARRKGIALGADEFLVKPFATSDLVDRISALLKASDDD